MTKNFAANLKIGAAMGSSVGRVFGGLKTKIKEQEATLKKLRAAYKDAAKGTGEYAGKLGELKAHTAAAEKELKRLKAAANFDIGKGFRNVGGTVLGDFKRLGVMAGIATGAVLGTGAAVYSVTKGFVDWADDIGDSAEALGMSTQALQTWQFAAATVGVGGQKMTASIAKFSKAVMEGGDATDEALAKLHINGARLRKVKLDEQLEVVAEAFKDYKGADKAALAMKLFGKSGYQLAGILSKGKKGLDEFRKAGEETGAVLDDKAAEAAGKAASALDMFGITLVGLRNTIAIQFVPALQRLTERFTTLIRDNGPKIREWASQFATLIETRVVPALGRFMDKLPAIVDQLATFATNAWNVLTAVKDLVGGWDNLGYVILALNFAPTIAAVGNLTASLWTMTGATWAALGPWGALLALFTAMMAVVGDGNPWEGLKFSIHAIGVEIEALGRLIGGELTKLSNWLGRNTEAAIGAVREALDTIKLAFIEFFDWIGSKFDWIGNKIAALFASAKSLGSSIGNFFGMGGEPAAAPAAPLVQPGAMPSNKTSMNQNNNFNINVNAPGADGRRIADQLRNEFNRKPLFDSDGALVPG